MVRTLLTFPTLRSAKAWAVAMPNAGIDLIVVLNEAPDEKIPVGITTAKVGDCVLQIQQKRRLRKSEFCTVVRSKKFRAYFRTNFVLYVK